MQSNDLNILSTANWGLKDFQNPESLISKIKVSPFQCMGRVITEDDVQKLKATKVPPSAEMLIEVRKTVHYYETLGKSRRWIRRYIKRKFNITEY